MLYPAELGAHRHCWRTGTFAAKGLAVKFGRVALGGDALGRLSRATGGAGGRRFCVVFGEMESKLRRLLRVR